MFYAVDALDGHAIWSFPGGRGSSSPAFSRDGKVVYVGSADNYLNAVDALDGSTIWSFQTGDAERSSPALSNDGLTVYIGSTDGGVSAIPGLYAVDALIGSDLPNRCCGGLSPCTQ